MVDVVTGGPLTRWDAMVLARVEPVEPGWPTDVATVLADAGHWPIQGGFLLVLAAGLAAVTRSMRPLVIAGAGLVTVGLVGAALKVALGRTAPWAGTDQVFTGSSAYPSGHAAGAVVVGLLAAHLMAPATALSARERICRGLVVIAGIGWPVLMGWSRIHLGVHWASDVLGGWLLGLAVVLVVRRADALGKDVGSNRRPGALERHVPPWTRFPHPGRSSRRPIGPGGPR